MQFPSKYSSVVVLVAACGGGSNVTPDTNQIIDDAPMIDTPSCMPAVPAKVAVAAGGAVSASFVEGFEITSSNEVVVKAYDGANGDMALVWEGSAWVPHATFTNINGGFGRQAMSEIDGRPVVLANVSDQTSDSGKLRYWLQLSTNAFATGARVDATTAVTEARAGRYSAASSVFSVAADDQSKTLLSYERNSAGTWTTAQVAFVATATSVYAAGLGSLTDGTAVMGGAVAAATATAVTGFYLYRRSGVSWSQYRTLATGIVYDANLKFPPQGTAGTAAVAMYIDSTTNKLRGEFVSVTDGTPSGAADLLPMTGLTAIDSEIVFQPDGLGGKILVVDGNFNSPHAWIVNFTGTSFTAAQELRPDLVFDTYPHLAYHPCGGYMILHASRAPTDSAINEAAVVEPLSVFAPGL